MIGRGLAAVAAILALTAPLRQTSQGLVVSTAGGSGNQQTVAAETRATNGHAVSIGHKVMKLAANGHSVAGVVVRQSQTRLWIRPVFSRKGTEVLTLASNAVIWQGGWRFLGRLKLRRMHVDLVTRKKNVLGILVYHDAYGRVVRRRNNWVTIQAVKGVPSSNPACRPAVGRHFVARINAATVWSSPRYLLPRHSLVQYTVYGVPGYSFMLGGVEDYGHALCHARRVQARKKAAFSSL